jgi:hypothetical protein
MMGINKVILNDATKLDLTADTVTADTLANGVTAHNAAGDIITGTFNPVTSFNGRTGAVTPQSGDYSYDQISNTPTGATSETDGLMSSTDKSKLDGIEEGANKTVVDTEVTVDSDNAVSGGAVYAAIDSLKPKKLTATLTAEETTLTFTDDAITETSRIYIETDVFGVEPTTAEVFTNPVSNTSTLTLTFDAQTDDIGVTVFIFSGD